VRRGESAPLGRQREGEQKMVGRNQALHLTLQPLLALVVLAVRAKAMAAGCVKKKTRQLSTCVARKIRSVSSNVMMSGKRCVRGALIRPGATQGFFSTCP